MNLRVLNPAITKGEHIVLLYSTTSKMFEASSLIAYKIFPGNTAFTAELSDGYGCLVLMDKPKRNDTRMIPSIDLYVRLSDFVYNKEIIKKELDEVNYILPNVILTNLSKDYNE